MNIIAENPLKDYWILCLFVSLRLYVLVNHFSVILGCLPRLITAPLVSIEPATLDALPTELSVLPLDFMKKVLSHLRHHMAGFNMKGMMKPLKMTVR